MATSKRSTAYHEAAHAVAAYFHPLSGKTQRICISGDDLTEHNLPKYPTNEAAVGRSVHREKVHDLCILLLSGYAAGWVYSGEDRSSSKCSGSARAYALKHADGSDDFTRCWKLLDQFDANAVLGDAEADTSTGAATVGEVQDRARRAVRAHTAQTLDRFEMLWQEASAFVVEKWTHIQAVADAAFRKKTIEGSEISEIIERIEERLQSYPPQILAILDRQRARPL
jgi:ATP-dependent Zn protease